MKFKGNTGANRDVAASVQKSMRVKFPVDFIDYLKSCNGGEGFIGTEYLMLWKLEELEEFNSDYEVHEYIPDVVLFGSNGGGEAYGFRTAMWLRRLSRYPLWGWRQRTARRSQGRFQSHEIAGAVVNNLYRSKSSDDCLGKEIFEIPPVILGGVPVDPRNKTFFSRQDHIKAVVYWNRVIRDLRKQGTSKD